jgi:hypothetical protein
MPNKSRTSTSILLVLAWIYFIGSIAGAWWIFSKFASVPEFPGNAALADYTNVNPIGVVVGIAVLLQGLVMFITMWVITSIADDVLSIKMQLAGPCTEQPPTPRTDTPSKDIDKPRDWTKGPIGKEEEKTKHGLFFSYNETSAPVGKEEEKPSSETGSEFLQTEWDLLWEWATNFKSKSH